MKDYYYLLISLFFFAIVLIYRNGYNRHKRNIRSGERVIKKLASIEHDGAKLNYLRKINPFVFEELILSAFKDKGYKIKRNKMTIFFNFFILGNFGFAISR